MNWTEGGLARHSRASKSRTVLLRQKEHFAKARSGLLNANVKMSPSSISFLVHPALSSSPSRHPSAQANNPGPSSFSKKRTRGKDPPHSSHYFQDDGLDLSTPAEFQKDWTAEETLRQKRGKLLLKGDWTGINLQKPIEMAFSKPRASLGGPWGQSKSRHMNSSKSRLRHVLGVSHNAVQNKEAHEVGAEITRSGSPGQWRVRVGSREKDLGGSSNASGQSRTCRDVESSPRVAPVARLKHRERRKRRANHARAATSKVTQASKSPELHQPVPHRPFLPSLHRSQSSDPDDAASTKARVGALRPVVDPSQLEHNNAWWGFVSGAECCQDFTDLQPSVDQDSVQREISPGVSHIGLISGPHTPDERCKTVQGSKYMHDGVSEGQDTFARENCLQSERLKAATSDDIPLATGELFASCESKSPSLGSSPPLPKQLVGFDEEVGLGKDCGMFVTSDEVSQVMLPTSSSPTTSEETFAQSCNLDNLQEGTKPHHDEHEDHEDHDRLGALIIAPADLCRSEQPLRSQEPEEFFTVTQQPEKGPETNFKPRSPEEDQVDMWRKFVFGDSEDNLEESYLEAIKETAKNLCPSEPSTDTDDETSEEPCLYSEPLEIGAALTSSSGIDGPDFTIQGDSSRTNTNATASISNRATPGVSSPDPIAELNSPTFISHYTRSNDNAVMGFVSDEATAGNSSSDPLLELNPQYPGTAVQTDSATVSSSKLSRLLPFGVEHEFMCRSDAWSLVTCDNGGNDGASVVAHPPPTHESSEVAVFRFTRPKPFTGKRIQIDEQRQIALSAAQIRGKGVTQRRQKPIGDGRARIRNLPNFGDDPIEEVEDSSQARSTLKPLMFSSLDTEDNFEG